nr:LOW QUALITY PROTEIN: major facilitator superfamily domain-containing protein 6-A-like [Cherax quadricarinatus]
MGLNVNKTLLPIKIAYFLKYGGIAFFPFLPVVLRNKGVSATGVGLIWAVTPMASFANNLVVGMIADGFRIHRALFLSGMVILSCSFVSVFLLPPVPRPPGTPSDASVSLQCGDNSSLAVCYSQSQAFNTSALISVQQCNFGNEPTQNATVDNNKLDCTLHCSVIQDQSISTVNDNDDFEAPPEFSFHFGKEILILFAVKETVSSSIKQTVHLHLHGLTTLVARSTSLYVSTSVTLKAATSPLGIFHTNEFWLYFICLIFLYGSTSCTTTLCDTVCFFLLGKERYKYGRQRMWGSVAFAMVGMASGALVNFFSRGQPQVNYMPALILSGTFLVFNLIASSRIKFNLPQKEKLEAKNVGRVLCSSRMLIFLLTVLVTGLISGVVMTFMFIVVEDVATAWDPDFPYMKLLLGIIHGVSVFLGEVPFMFLSSTVIKRLGNIPTFAVSLASYSIRFFVFSFIINPWLFIVTSLLHGLSFGLFYPNMSAYASLMSPKGAQAVMQGIVKSAFIGGTCLGGVVGGVLLKTVGGSMGFRYISLLAGTYAVFFVIAQLLIHKLCSKHTPEDDRGEYSAPGSGEVTQIDLDATVLASVTDDSIYSSSLQIA